MHEMSSRGKRRSEAGSQNSTQRASQGSVNLCSRNCQRKRPVQTGHFTSGGTASVHALLGHVSHLTTLRWRMLVNISILGGALATNMCYGFRCLTKETRLEQHFGYIRWSGGVVVVVVVVVVGQVSVVRKLFPLSQKFCVNQRLCKDWEDGMTIIRCVRLSRQLIDI